MSADAGTGSLFASQRCASCNAINGMQHKSGCPQAGRPRDQWDCDCTRYSSITNSKFLNQCPCCGDTTPWAKAKHGE